MKPRKKTHEQNKNISERTIKKRKNRHSRAEYKNLTKKFKFNIELQQKTQKK